MKRFRNILCLVGNGAGDDCALARALDLARSNQAHLTIAAVVEQLPTDLRLEGLNVTRDALQQALVDKATAHLDALIADRAEDLDAERLVLTGELFLAVIRDVLGQGRDLVIKCAGDTGMLDRLLGSDDMHLLRKCPCPLWLLRPTPQPRFRRVLAAVDVDQLYPEAELGTRRELSLSILEIAASLAVAEFAELHVVHAWDSVAESVMRLGALSLPDDQIQAHIAAERRRHGSALDAALHTLGERIGAEALSWLKPVLHLPKGPPQQVLPAVAADVQADVVVLGTVGRSGLAGLFIGNTAENVLQRLDCSVLALKPRGFVSPVGL
jgi:nucleotide-binding universal stress UspA family protein